MGLMDKLKGAVNAVTGGGADVSLEMPPGPFSMGEKVKVKVTVVSTGGEIRSNGVHVDIRATERGTVRGTELCNSCNKSLTSTITVSRTTVDVHHTISPAFVLGKGEVKVLEGSVTIPPGQPTYHGSIDHIWEIRARLESFGNDPDSKFRQFIIKG